MASNPESVPPPILTPGVYSEEPPSFDSTSTSTSTSNSNSNSTSTQHQQQSPSNQARERENTMGRMADGIGGRGIGTAATGDLSAQQEFQTLTEIRSNVKELESDYNTRHPDSKLSGRIIHVAHYIPFVVRSLAEVDFERRKEERINAINDVAAMAAAARAKRAARQAALQKQKEEAEQAKLQKEVAKGDEVEGGNQKKPERKSSFPTARAPSFSDFENRLAENQARSKMRAGRRAWMMTPVVDEDSDSETESLNDRFTPVGSRRQSSVSYYSSRGNSFSAYYDGGMDRKYSAVSDDNSPLATPPNEKRRREEEANKLKPQWVLTPRRGHTALNSGIRSLCATHNQTFIGWPGDLQFPKESKNDDRTDPSQTTLEERGEIEQVLASLDDSKNWRAKESEVKGVAPDPSNNDGAPPVGKVPTPLMNGADPIGDSATDGKGQKKKKKGGIEEEEAEDPNAEKGIKYVPVWLDYNVAHGHYEGYCKTTLWPLFHYLLWQDVPSDRRAWEDYSWDAYYSANEAFAKKIAEEWKPGDIVWVHDYHLLLVPLMLRKLVPDAHIGLFVHAPFPSSEVFRCLPKRREILEGMLGADLACFQAFSYSRHFLSSCIRVCGFEASANSVESFNGHITNISYNPIGIDAIKIAKDSASEGVAPKIEQIREMYRGKKIIVGRDKLDVVRGVIQKLQAFHKFLEEFPEWRDKVVLIQVTAPALNDSPKLERQVSELVSHINGEFGSLSFTPVHHYHQIIERDEYFALLSVADLALITSVRDGMNTTSMEYIVCQERFNKSPLILSEFTGTAGRMRSAIQVNPWNIFGVAKAIDYGLKLNEKEKIERHDSLHHQVISHTSHSWAASLVKQVLVRLMSEHSAHFTPPLKRELMVQQFKKANKRLLLLDYDGTLTPIVKNPDDALPSPKLLKSLETLSNDPRNVIYVISGRDETFLSKHLGHLENFGFSAEHGCFVREPRSKEWINMTKELDMSWMKDVRKVFEYYTERTSGSAIEQKKSSITWHYRNADPDYGSFQAKECQAHMENLTTQNKLDVEVLVGKKNLEVRPLAVNKGEIVKRILYSNADAEFVFCAGDDKTDEDMFRALASLTTANDVSGSLNVISKGSRGTGGGGFNSTSNASPTSVGVTSTSTLKVPTMSSINNKRESNQDESSSIKKIKGACTSREECTTSLVMSPPTPLSANTPLGSPKTLALTREGIFTTTIGPSGKKTLASWHVDGVDRIIDSLAEMAGLDDPSKDQPSDQEMPDA